MPYFKTENSNAENIKYDNTKSVKEAIDDIKDNVQDAVTEINGNLSKEVFLTSTISTQYVDVNLDLSQYRSIRLEIANVASGNNFIMNNVTIDTERFMRDCNSNASFLGCYAYSTAPIVGRAYYKGNNIISIYVNTNGFETRLYGIK